MPTYYDYGLGLDDPTQITETGDELASAANYIEPENVDFAHYTWENQPVSEYVTRLIRDSDHPQLSSSLIYITIPSGSPHIIYDSTNTVLVSGNAQENNDRDFTLDYTLRGATTDADSLAEDNVWSFTTAALEFGNTEVEVGINSDIGIRDTDSVIISRTPTLSPVITVTTPTTAPTATTIYDEMDIGGTAVDPNSLPIQRVDYTATAPGDTVYTQYWGDDVIWQDGVNAAYSVGDDWYYVNGPGGWVNVYPGSWYVGYRPDKIRLEGFHDVTGNWDVVMGGSGGTTATVTFPESAQWQTVEADITWGSGDIASLYLDAPSTGRIRNIEFGVAGVGTDESGKATGTDNWSFNVPLIVGDTTVDVTGSNTYSLSGSDSIVVTRTEPQNPIVTITTETSATTASEITIEGTASDPNGLNIVSVTYELSGARTDSGVATGTTAWTFTEGLSAGDNRFDVTAINDWSPPTSGGDSLIVNYNPPSPPAGEDFNDRTLWDEPEGVPGYWGILDGNTVWNTDHYECSGTVDVNFIPTAWARSVRPTKVRMYHTAGSATFQIIDQNSTVMATGASYASGTELDITYDGQLWENNIYRLQWALNTDGGGAGNITAIEFLEPDLDYFYDYFVGQPGSNERWISRRVPTGGNWDLDLTGGMDATMDDEDQILVRQIWNQGEIDVWGNIDIWDQPSGDMSIYLVFRGDDGANASEFTLQWDGSQHNLNIQASDGGGSDELDLQDIGQNNVWIRLKYKPITDSDTKMHLYYAFSDPTVGGWTEATLSVSPIFDPAYTATGEYWRLEIEFTNDSVEDDLGLEVESLTEWTG